MHFFLGSYYQSIFKKSSLKIYPQDELHVLLLANSLGNSSPEALPGPLLGKRFSPVQLVRQSSSC